MPKKSPGLSRSSFSSTKAAAYSKLGGDRMVIAE
jgi:hypothetical protein